MPNVLASCDDWSRIKCLLARVIPRIFFSFLGILPIPQSRFWSAGVALRGKADSGEHHVSSEWFSQESDQRAESRWETHRHSASEGRRTRHWEEKARLVLRFRGPGFDQLIAKELMVKELTKGFTLILVQEIQGFTGLLMAPRIDIKRVEVG